MIHFKRKGEHSVNELEQICMEQIELLHKKQLQIQSNQKKADDWDKLGDAIEEVYNDDSGGGDLCLIGEKSAMAYGWL